MIEIKGLDELSKKIRNISKNLRDVQDVKKVPLPELLTDGFVAKHTKFETLLEFIDCSGFSLDSDEDFKNIPEKDWDDYIRSVSKFDGWESMLSIASEEWLSRKLNLS